MIGPALGLALFLGEGDPIVFLHGNPTSSYLWRKVMPALKGKGRLIAPDLIGMGDSDKLDNSGPDSYRFVEHKAYLFALLIELGGKSEAGDQPGPGWPVKPPIHSQT